MQQLVQQMAVCRFFNLRPTQAHHWLLPNVIAPPTAWEYVSFPNKNKTKALAKIVHN